MTYYIVSLLILLTKPCVKKEDPSTRVVVSAGQVCDLYRKRFGQIYFIMMLYFIIHSNLQTANEKAEHSITNFCAVKMSSHSVK